MRLLSGRRRCLALLTAGSRGDVQPIVALGAGLARRGHEVRLATHPEFETIVRSAGLDFRRLEGNPRRLLESPEGREWLQTRSPLRFVRKLREMARPLLDRVAADSLAACEGADAIVFTALTGGYHTAERLGLPCCQAALQPQTATGAFPAVALPQLPLGPRTTPSRSRPLTSWAGCRSGAWLTRPGPDMACRRLA